MGPEEFNRLLESIKYNEKALEKLYKFYYPKIVKRLSFKYGRTLAEDAAQDFFMNLLDICDKNNHVDNPTNWVYTCAENIAKRKVKFDSRFMLSNEVMAQDDSELKAEDKILAQTLLDKLDETERKIIYMTYWEGYTKKEIAVLLGKKHTYIRKIYERAIKKLKQYV